MMLNAFQGAGGAEEHASRICKLAGRFGEASSGFDGRSKGVWKRSRVCLRCNRPSKKEAKAHRVEEAVSALAKGMAESLLTKEPRRREAVKLIEGLARVFRADRRIADLLARGAANGLRNSRL